MREQKKREIIESSNLFKGLPQEQIDIIFRMTTEKNFARGETIFEKPSFRESARYKRCLIYVDGFYEHHHFKGKTYPFLIKKKNNEPVILA